MQEVRITSVAVAHPGHRVRQDEAARLIGLEAGEPRRVAALARGTHIEERAFALPLDRLRALSESSIGARNAIYRELAPAVALQAAQAAIGDADPSAIGCLVTSSCTGYTVPSWGVGLAEQCELPRDAVRLPITEAGCAGGAVGLARAVDYLRTHEAGAGLVVATELCSLAFHPGGDDGNLTSALIFGDGAGSALLETGAGPGVTVVDSMSVLIPGTQWALGFDLTDQGFYPLLARELVSLLPGPTEAAVSRLLGRNSLERTDIGAWLLHPGGARILAGLERALCLDPRMTRWSWESLREFGNTSSAAIFDVLRRYLGHAPPGEYAVVAAFGPGVSIELLLLRASC